MPSEALPGLLDGLRVLDFTNMMAGPYCTRLLADLGAEVIKVEAVIGDHNRGRDPLRNGLSSFFGHLNCGKKSIVLDLKSKPGLEAGLDLVKHSDVVIENWRPGVAERLGLGYSALSQLKPDLVYCSISGYGQTGPGAFRPAYAPIIHAISGFDLAQTAYRADGDRPPPTGTYMADAFAGLASFGAIQSALFRRERLRTGQYIDVALLDSMFNLLVAEIQQAQFPGQELRIYTPVKALDGYVMVAPTSQRLFEDLARLVGHPEWIEDPRFKLISVREKNWRELSDLIESWTRERSMLQCEELFLNARIPCTRYRSVAEAMQDPQVIARGSFSTIRDKAGEFLVPNPPFQMPGLNVSARSYVAELGEHTREVLIDILGYSPERAQACIASTH